MDVKLFSSLCCGRPFYAGACACTRSDAIPYGLTWAAAW